MSQGLLIHEVRMEVAVVAAVGVGGTHAEEDVTEEAAKSPRGTSQLLAFP